MHLWCHFHFHFYQTLLPSYKNAIEYIYAQLRHMDETIGCSGVGGNQQVTTQAAPVQSNDDDDLLEQFDSDQFNPDIIEAIFEDFMNEQLLRTAIKA